PPPAPAPEAVRASDTLPDEPVLRVLIAEDHPVNQKLLASILSGARYRTTLASNGVEALRQFESASFDLILMDLQMPELTGLEATRQIRAIESRSGGHTPIIAMTAHAMSDDRQRCVDAGMDDYLSKPAGRKEVLAA